MASLHLLPDQQTETTNYGAISLGSGSTILSSLEGGDISVEEFCRPASYFNNSFKILKLTLPVILGYVIEFLNPFISSYAVARLGPNELASSALSFMFANVTGWSIVFGMTTSLDTLCSQAFTGAADPKQVGVYLQRGFLVTMTLLVPVSLVWWHTEGLLLAIGQEPELARLCGIYLRWSILTIPGFVLFECTKKFLQAQGIMQAATHILVVSLPVGGILNYLLVHHPTTSLGFVGAPIASGLTMWFCALSSVFYVFLIDGKQAWGGLTVLAFQGWWPFLQLGIPGIVQICSEWWAYELMALGASYLSINALAAHSVVSNISGLFYQSALGAGVVASNLIGNALGQGFPNTARHTAFCCLAVVFLFGLVCSFLVLYFSSFWSTLFNDDPEIVRTVSSLLPILAIFQIGEAISGLGNGVLRGLGRQDLGATINLTVFYLIAVPIGFLLAFTYGLGVMGLWVGFCLGLWLIATVSIYIIFTANWSQESIKALERVSKSSASSLRSNSPQPPNNSQA